MSRGQTITIAVCIPPTILVLAVLLALALRLLERSCRRRKHRKECAYTPTETTYKTDAQSREETDSQPSRLGPWILAQQPIGLDVAGWLEGQRKEEEIESMYEGRRVRGKWMNARGRDRKGRSEARKRMDEQNLKTIVRGWGSE
jgi:hypothetical protein